MHTPTINLRFNNGRLQQLHTSTIVGEKDEWRDVPGQPGSTGETAEEYAAKSQPKQAWQPTPNSQGWWYSAKTRSWSNIEPFLKATEAAKDGPWLGPFTGYGDEQPPPYTPVLPADPIAEECECRKTQPAQAWQQAPNAAGYWYSEKLKQYIYFPSPDLWQTWQCAGWWFGPFEHMPVAAPIESREPKESVKKQAQFSVDLWRLIYAYVEACGGTSKSFTGLALERAGKINQLLDTLEPK